MINLPHPARTKFKEKLNVLDKCRKQKAHNYTYKDGEMHHNFFGLEIYEEIYFFRFIWAQKPISSFKIVGT